MNLFYVSYIELIFQSEVAVNKVRPNAQTSAFSKSYYGSISYSRQILNISGAR